MPRARRFAVGDPQAPLSRLRAILARHALLRDDGRLLDDGGLVSLGDHFDHGGAAERRAAARDGLEVLDWLASHPPDQVVLIAGNHDLARVGELCGFSDEDFERAHAEACEAYRDGDVDPEREARLLARYPALPTAELAARDFAAFQVAQRERVEALLRARRLRLAHAEGGVLYCHAGVTVDVLRVLDLPDDAEAAAIAEALDRRLDQALDAWRGGPLAIPELHRPGSADHGEGVGMLYHRPAHPDVPANAGYALRGTLSRRFDARRIPQGLTQVVGHIGDRKCRELLGPWADDAPARGGVLRHLVTDGTTVRYAHGLPPAHDERVGTMIFIDGGMARTPVDDYALLPLPLR
ncbi:MAG: metallophosphoesterase [Myxococcales bacterium]|nr:metallophosphoesterase [Myxococcales bacterium]